MLKTAVKLKYSKGQAVALARDLLDGVPSLQVEPVEIGWENSSRYGFEGLIGFTYDDNLYLLAVKAMSSGEPRFVRSETYQFKGNTEHLRRSCEASKGRHLIPMLVCPYMSPHSRAICVEHDIAYLDLIGNARLAFDKVFIERAVAERPAAEIRKLRSVFTPRAAAILRVLLRDPDRPWRVADLSAESGASYGHVSNVRKALLEREWAEDVDGGIVLIRPGTLLENWRESYRRPTAETEIFSGYTHLHGAEFDARIREILNPDSAKPRAIYAKHSAAQWLAPFGRVATQSFYVDAPGAEAVSGALGLAHTERGANVILEVLADDSLFDDTNSPAPGVFCTSPVVTYLDLWNGGGRDREAAEHLAKEFFPWLK